jgi:electron transfer flavoprotein alpha subunit
MNEGAIWVVVEREDEGRERAVVHELLSGGRDLADGLERELHAVVVGNGDPELGDRIEGHPDRIVFLEGAALTASDPDVHVNALQQAVEERKPLVVMSSTSLRAMDFMPRLAVRLGVGMVSEATLVRATSEGKIRVQRPIQGGRFLAELEAEGTGPFLVAVRPRALERTQGGRAAQREKLPVDLPEGEAHTAVLERQGKPSHVRDLTEAEVVVAGGRGMKGAEHFGMLEELASLLGATVGASRAVVDSKWRPPEEQVGKSGKTVSPELYLAFGIAGAVHHIMGMDTAKVVVAVNSDPKAIIFQYADYGIVDDLFKVLPAMIEEIRKKRGE